MLTNLKVDSGDSANSDQNETNKTFQSGNKTHKLIYFSRFINFLISHHTSWRNLFIFEKKASLAVVDDFILQ